MIGRHTKVRGKGMSRSGRRALCVLCIWALIIMPEVSLSQTIPLSERGRALKKHYDQANVENLWLKGYQVDWETGQSLKKAHHPKTTHCSAFVAALLKRNGLYILRPPEHMTKNLANAQYDYLETEKAKEDGWVKLNGMYQDIQRKANEGYFVVAVVKNKNVERSGHIALVYPMEVREQEVKENGPYVIQAGHLNGKGISLKKGFEKHYKDFSKFRAAFYYNSRKYEDQEHCPNNGVQPILRPVTPSAGQEGLDD